MKRYLPITASPTSGADKDMGASTLTRRETEIAEYLAWGASKKEVATTLYISERTVENHTRRIYEKIGITKINELAAWWFCTTFHISFDLSPLKRKIGALMLLALIIPQMIDTNTDMIRPAKARTAQVCRCNRCRRSEDNGIFLT